MSDGPQLLTPAPGLAPGAGVRVLVSALAVAALVGVGAWLASGTSRSSFDSWVSGALLGFVFQRGGFCFFCSFRDFIEQRKARGVLAILAALAVGLVGYHVILSTWLPNPFGGRLPPEAFVSPVSWVVAAGGLAFGLGMALSGACISGHLYRLGEGYGRAPIALVGSLVGFGLGFLSWRTLYVEAISYARPLWLPAILGHGGALALQLAVVALLALVLLLLARDRPRPERNATGWTLPALGREVFVRRWPPLVTGAAVGLIGVAAYFRFGPLGVTAQLSTLSRTAMDSMGLLDGRLPGLDTLAGCIAVVSRVILDNGWLIIAFVVGAALAAWLSGRQKLTLPTLGNSATALVGGVLLGWGSMVALGCTVGALLSGIMAGAVSGWVFLPTCFLGVWLGVRLRLHRLGERQ